MPLRETGDFVWKDYTNRIIEIWDVISVSNSLEIEEGRIIKVN